MVIVEEYYPISPRAGITGTGSVGINNHVFLKLRHGDKILKNKKNLDCLEFLGSGGYSKAIYSLQGANCAAIEVLPLPAFGSMTRDLSIVPGWFELQVDCHVRP